MRKTALTTVCVLTIGALLVACSTDEGSESGWRGGTVAPENAGQDVGDRCAPGNEADGDEMPDAMCALKSEYHVPDLGDPSDVRSADEDVTADADITTKTLVPLDASGAGRTSCHGTGPGLTTCGLGGTDSCCRSTTVPAGRADASTKVTTAFELGVYEVTSGRFAAFVTAFGGNLRGAANQGKLPGFDAAHAKFLPASLAEVNDALGPSCQARSNVADYGALTWPAKSTENAVATHITDKNARAADIRADATAARLHAKPINCVSYYAAEAFCAWDGGRLPTNVEWIYTALGGAQRRAYPWGPERTADKLVTDLNRDENSFTYPEDFPWFDNYFNAYHIAPPGKKPAGVSRWGQMDMGGNVLEWVADIIGPNQGIVRGGSWEGHKDKNTIKYTNYPLDRSYGSLGFRCAYGGQPAAAAAPAPPAPAAALAPVYRAYSAKQTDHLQGRTKGEGAPAYVEEGISFQVWAAPVADGRPLHRCRAGTSHFLSNDAACEGKTSEGLVGYVASADTAATKPIYRCVSSDGKDHLSTLTPAECTKAGLKVEGTQGFAIP